MVKMGDKLFHWRYGELTVLKSEPGRSRGYINVKVEDLNGVKEDPSNPDWSKYFKHEEKNFNSNEVGHWLHYDIINAVIGNCNSNEPYPKSLEAIGEHQGQKDLAMIFPIRGNLLHESYKDILEKKTLLELEIKELKKDKKENESYLIDINKTYENHKLKYNNIIKEILILKDLKDTIEIYIKENNIDGQEHKFLGYIIEDSIKEKLDWDKSYENGIRKVKTDFKNDDAYNEFVKKTKLILNNIKEEHDKNIVSIANKLDDIYKIKPFESMKDIIERYKSDANLLNEKDYKDIYDCLAIEKEEETRSLELQKVEIDKKIKEKDSLLEKFKRLDDKNYIVFE